MNKLVSKTEEEVREVVDAAGEAFWKVVAEAFPTAKQGDYPPELVHDFAATAENYIIAWARLNVPEEQPLPS